jgi:fumarylacetoacetate (FAA) hydrolase
VRLVSFRDPAGETRAGELESDPRAGDRVHELAAPSTLAWLAGDKRERTGRSQAFDEVHLLAPVPDPPSVRDFFAFEGHVAAGFRRRGKEIPAAWHEAPAFYFSNPASIHGPGEPVRRPTSTQMLDFELEIAAVVGRDVEIAGFMLMNDWSARDIQAHEMTVALGPHKGKDFATSLGPWMTTPDELRYEGGRLHLEATVTVNGREVARSSAAEQRYSWPELVAHAARDTRLRPGDVLGSGTLNGGCLLELGPLAGDRFIEPGDTVELSAPGLGTLRTPVV